MKILIDIIHPADVNFYKEAVKQLEKRGHQITFTVINRRNLQEIVMHEFPKNEIIPLGVHKGSFAGKVLNIMSRERLFLKLFRERKFDVVSSFGFYPGMTSWMRHIKSVNFHDDKEYRLNYFLTSRFASKFIPIHGQTYKELAYIRNVSDKVLKKLRVQKDKYVYVRDVSSKSLNYKDSTLFDYSKAFTYIRKKGYKIIYDSESGKSYSDTIVPPRPLLSEEMNGMKKNAALIITSGDTVLREAALSGVPVIYTSKRQMAINENLTKMFLTAKDPDDLLMAVEELLTKQAKQDQKKKAKAIINECEDMTKMIVEAIIS